MTTNVVVGAASGCGAASARELRPRSRLLLADRDLDGVTRLAAELGDTVEPIACDLTRPDQVDALVAHIGDELGALVIPAGLSGTMARGRTIFEVNLVGMARLLATVEPILGEGSVAVCFSSVAGHGVPPVPDIVAVLDDPLSEHFFERLVAVGIDPDGGAAYPLSKLGVLRMVRRLAPAWGARGARILSLSPGTTDTPMSRAEIAAHPIMEDMIKDRPLGRIGQPEEIAAVVGFLTSERASFMTGSDVLVDGGMACIVTDTIGGRLKIPTG